MKGRAAGTGMNLVRRKRKPKPPPYTKAGPVTTTKTDGSTETERALTRREFRAIIGDGR